MRTKIGKKKKTMHYQFGLKSKVKINNFFYKRVKGKKIKISIKLKTPIHDEKNLDM
jgi:hypothetical protein